MNDLIAFIRARIDEDERTARRAADVYDGATTWELTRATAMDVGERTFIAEIGADEDGFRPSELDHIARHDPARVLREVEAKRRILDEYRAAQANLKQHPDDLAGKGWLLGTVRVINLLALPYADHPDYRPEWAVAA